MLVGLDWFRVLRWECTAQVRDRVKSRALVMVMLYDCAVRRDGRPMVNGTALVEDDPVRQLHAF